MITTTTDNVWSTDVSLTNWQINWFKSGLPRAVKIIYTGSIFGLKTVGQLTSYDVKSVKVVLAKYVNVN